MTRDVIKEISEDVDLPEPLIQYVFEKSGKYIRKHLRTTEISRFSIKNLGVWRVNLTNVNNEIYYNAIRLLRYLKKVGEEEDYIKNFRYLWALRQHAINYKLRKKGKYYGSHNK